MSDQRENHAESAIGVDLKRVGGLLEQEQTRFEASHPTSRTLYARRLEYFGDHVRDRRQPVHQPPLPEGPPMRSRKAGGQGGPVLVLLTLALLTAAVAAGAGLLAGCGSAQPAGSTGTVGQTTAANASVTTTATSAPVRTTATSAAVTTTALPVASPTTTAEVAVPLGEEGRVGEWRVTVVSVTAPATELIAYTNEFNEPPPAGFDYLLITVQATYVGAGSAEFTLDIASTFVGSEGGEYGAPQGRAIAPQPMEDTGQVVSGETVSGDLVFEVSSAELARGRVRLTPSSVPGAGVFFATR
jgi:hypothetical protein